MTVLKGKQMAERQEWGKLGRESYYTISRLINWLLYFPIYFNTKNLCNCDTIRKTTYLFFLLVLLPKVVDHFLPKVISLSNPRFYRGGKKQNHFISGDEPIITLSMTKLKNSYKSNFVNRFFIPLRQDNIDLYI